MNFKKQIMCVCSGHVSRCLLLSPEGVTGTPAMLSVGWNHSHPLHRSHSVAAHPLKSCMTNRWYMRWFFLSFDVREPPGVKAPPWGDPGAAIRASPPPQLNEAPFCSKQTPFRPDYFAGSGVLGNARLCGCLIAVSK